MERVVISREMLDQLAAQAAASPDREVCGLLFGHDGWVTAAEATENVAADNRIHFEIDPTRLIAAYRAERNGGPRLIGHYHSHPSGSAAPSPCDRAAAEPGRLWLILAGVDARIWRAHPHGFEEVNLIFG